MMSARPTASELSGVVEDDVSLMTEEPGDVQGEGAIAGPGSWDDVVVEELQSIAANIARNAMPSAIGLEAGGGVDAGPRFAAAELDEANQDPLGYGRIDLQSLSLVKADGTRAIAKAPSMVDNRRQLSRNPTFSGPSVTARGGKGQYSKLRNKVLPSSNQFDPFAYLGIVHTDTSLQEMVEGGEVLRRHMTEQSGQLKALVRENFERFISCKTTIDDIEKGLRVAERGGGDGTNTTQVLDALKEVTEDAHHAFKPMLERQAHIEQIHSNMSLLKRYEAMFRMPLKLKQHARNKDYDQLITEYRNAKNILAGLSQLPNGEVWKNLFLEVDKTVEMLCGDLLKLLQSGSQSPAEALDTIKHVMQLQAENLEALVGVDPVELYLKGQEERIVKEFKTLAEENKGRVTGARMEAEVVKAEAAEKQGAGGGASRGDSASGASAISVENVLVQYAEKLTALLVRRAPNLWYMSTERLATLPGVGHDVHHAVEAAPERVEAAINAVLGVYRQQVLSAAQELTKCPATSPATHLGKVISKLAAAVGKLQDTDATDSIFLCIQSLVEECCALMLRQLQQYLSIVLERISSAKSWEVVGKNSIIIEGKAVPMSQASDWLRDILSGTLDTVSSTLQAAAATGLRDVSGLSPKHIRMLFFNSIMSFAVTLDRLTSQQEVGSNEIQMLNLLSVSSHVRAQIIPELMARYSNLLIGDGNEEEASALSGDVTTDLGEVGGRLLLTYKDERHHLLDTALEEYFFGDGMMWDAAPMPTGVRNTAVDLLHFFAKVEGDVFVHAPMVLQQIMMDLVGHLFQAFPPVLSSQLQHVSPGGLLQLWLEVHYFEEVLRRFLTPQVENTLDQVKAILWGRIEDASGKQPSLMEWMQLHEQRILSNSLTTTKLNTLCFNIDAR